MVVREMGGGCLRLLDTREGYGWWRRLGWVLVKPHLDQHGS